MAATGESTLSAPSTESEPLDVSATPYSLARTVRARRAEYVRPRRTKVKVGTWNVAACPGTDKDLAQWFVQGKGIEDNLETLSISRNSAAPQGQGKAGGNVSGDRTDIGLYVLGLQEIVDLNLTKEYMARAVYADNTATEKWKTALEAAMPRGYELVVAEQMFGLLLLVYASSEIAPTVGNVSTKQIGTGMGGWFANKGAVVTRLVLGETTRMVFVNCHLASGATAANLDRRCSDARQILSRTEFDPIVLAGIEEDSGEKIGDEDFAFWFGDLNFRLEDLPGDDIRRLLTLHTRGEYNPSGVGHKDPEGEGVIVTKGSETDDETITISSLDSHDQSIYSESTLPDPDDFPEDPSQDPTSLQATLDSLLPHDQLRRLMKERIVFHDGWSEGPITFLPTYKYDVGTVGLFDSSEKQRAPSWCDRILYRTRKAKQDYEQMVRDEQEARHKDEEMRSRGLEEDDDVLFTYDPDTDGDNQYSGTPDSEYDEYIEDDDVQPQETVEEEDKRETITLDTYTSHQRITSSDHKPITSVFTVDYDAVDSDLKSKVYAEVAWELDRAENEGRPVVTIVAEGSGGHDQNAVIDFGEMQFLEQKTAVLTVANTGGVAATLSFVQKPSGDSDDGDSPVETGSEWLSASFSNLDGDGDGAETLGRSATLEPGETVSAQITASIVSPSLVRALNDATSSLDDVLVLRVEDGRDHFIPVRGTWLPSCFGRSIDELIRVPDGGIRKFLADRGIKGSIPYDMEQKFSAPQELFKITTAMEDMAERCIADEAMLGDIAIPKAAGWPLDPEAWMTPAQEREELCVQIAAALDTAKPVIASMPLETPSPRKLEALSSALLLFLSYLTDGIIPSTLWFKLASSLGPQIGALPDAKFQILDVLSASPAHNIGFVFLTTALSRIATELTPPVPASAAPHRRLSFRRGPASNGEEEAMRRRRSKVRRFAAVAAPAVFRTGEVDQDKATREKTRAVLEVCLTTEGG